MAARTCAMLTLVVVIELLLCDNTRIVAASSAAPPAIVDAANGGARAKAVPPPDERVVISEHPEFFTYTLATVAALLTAITILIGIGTGVGLTLVLRARAERLKFEQVRRKHEEAYEAINARLERRYCEMVDAMKRTAFGLGSVSNAKAELRQLLADEHPETKAVYKAIYKTVKFADAECVRLYGRILSKFGKDLDIVRIVRTGLIQYGGDSASAVSGKQTTCDG